MAQLKEIRSRIASVKNTRQVTSAMKLVSAAKLKKAQDAILQISPYDNYLHQIIQHLSLGDVNFNSVYFSQPTMERVLVIVIGANRGLCGAFNSNAAKTSMLYVIEQYSAELRKGNVQFFSVGRQVEKALKTKNVNLYGEAHDLLNDHDFKEVSIVAEKLMELFAQGTFQRIDLVYNKFKNAAVQELTTEQYLPIKKPEQKEKTLTKIDYIFEPSQDSILNSIVPQSLKMQLYRVLLDSNAAEQGARMTAMHQATDNATDMLKDLHTTYNNARQAAITNEILEITAGAEALKG